MRLSIVLSALVAALVGFAGTLALIIAAAEAVGATPAQTSSWVAALCIGKALTSAYLSIRYRMPIITAWSTPGASLIGASAGAASIDQAVGAFLLAGLLVVATAMFRPVAALIERIPTAIAAAMLAGILIRFVIAIFEQAGGAPLLVLPLLAIFLVTRLVSPSGAVLAAFAAGLALTATLGLAPDLAVALALSDLQWITPEFDAAVLISMGLPLYLVTMASQNLPGFAVLRASGYAVPTRPILAVTGFASVLTAPFGAHSTNLAAIMASICTGPDTHPDPQKRWLTGPVYALAYLSLAAFGASVVAMTAALPAAIMATVGGLALVGPLTHALGAALAEPQDRLPATLTLAVTASGMVLAGIGSAFWGLLAGLFALALQAGAERWRSRRGAPDAAGPPA